MFKKGHRSKRRVSSRLCSGVAIMEFAAALMLLLPLTIVVCYVAAEAMQICMIKSVLNHGAAVAARRLSIAYASDPASAIANPEASFENVRINNVIIDDRQFAIPAGTAGWNLYSKPPTVCVEVTFKGGLYGLPTFPNPDPLNLGANFVLKSSAKANLE
jgi:Flp pilus assembly protein TadG